MKFGKVDNPGLVDFSIPDDHPHTEQLLSGVRSGTTPSAHIGCAKWSRSELKKFYPKGTKDELAYYAGRFNAIELNATYYRNFPADQIRKWREKVPAHFRFYPKVSQEISHRKWLSDVGRAVDDYLESIMHFDEKLGTVFLQMRDNFSPKYFNRLVSFIELWPGEIPLAVELRHRDWFQDGGSSEEYYQLLEENNISNVLVDTAGRRDLMHMRLTNGEVFVRFVGANHSSDSGRLDDWVQKLKVWVDQGLENINFFVHQNVEMESPQLADYFRAQLETEFKGRLIIPGSAGPSQSDLF